MAISPAHRGNSFLMLRTGVYFLVGVLLVVGQLVPGVTHQIAEGEMLPQTLLWLLAAALIASENQLSRWLGNNPARKESFDADLALTSNASFTDGQYTYWLPIVAAIFGLVMIAFSAWYVSGNGNLRYAINTAWQWGGLIASLYVLVQLMTAWRVARMIFAIIFAMALLSMLHGWYQVNVTLPIDRESFKNNPEAVLREHGIYASPGTAEYLRFESRLRDETPLGPFALTNSLAGFLVPWVVMAIGLGLRRDFWRSAPWRAGLGFFVLLTLLWCIAATESRAAWIAIMLGLFTIILCKIVSDLTLRARISIAFRRAIARERSLPLAVMGLIGLAIAVLALRNLDSKSFFSDAWKSLSFRADYWEATRNIIRDRPVLGVGPGNFQAHYSAYKTILAPEVISDPHNFILETAATAGLPAGILLLLAIGWLIWKTFGFLGSHTTETENSTPTAKALNVDSRSLIKATSALYFGAIGGAFALWLGHGALGNPPDVFPFAVAFPIVMLVLAADYFASLNATLRPMEPKGLVVAMFAALIAIFVHLSASSGWLTPGIMNSILVLVAGIVTVIRRAEQRGENTTSESYSAWTLVITIGAWSFLGLFYWMAWLPFQSCKQIEALAFQDGLTEPRALAMIHGDPFNPRGYAFLVEVYVAQGEHEIQRAGVVSEATMARFDAALKQFLAVDAAEEGAWFQAAQWEMRLSTSRLPGLKHALNFFQTASVRDPGDVAVLIQVALLAWLCEDTTTTHEFLTRAEAIDIATPHADKKINAATVYWPLNVGPSSARMKPQVWQQARQSEGLPSGWARAREVCNFLRSQIGNAAPAVR